MPGYEGVKNCQCQSFDRVMSALKERLHCNLIVLLSL